MFDVSIWSAALVALLVLAVVAWLYSLATNNVSHVDSLWSLMFLLAAGSYASLTPELTTRAWLVLLLTALWALRLSLYITWRNRGEEEDRRYRKIRQNNEPNFRFKSLYIVFGLQSLLAWLISLPLLAAITSAEPLGFLDVAGVLLWVIGFVFEAGGDWQLARFKGNPENDGKVMQSGLWRYTRHPNYFGNFCIWWGYFLIAVAAGGWWSILSPVLMTFLLLKVSGVALLEKDISERRPKYKEYIERTNAFFPGPPKSIEASNEERVIQ